MRPGINGLDCFSRIARTKAGPVLETGPGLLTGPEGRLSPDKVFHFRERPGRF